jgi:hypothetical protein
MMNEEQWVANPMSLYLLTIHFFRTNPLTFLTFNLRHE